MKYIVSSRDDFTPVLGCCSPDLILCPKCPYEMASSYEFSPRFSWGLSLFCKHCDSMWMICTHCPKLRAPFCFGSEMMRHHKSKHLMDSDRSVGVKRSIAETAESGLSNVGAEGNNNSSACAEVSADVENGCVRRMVVEELFSTNSNKDTTAKQDVDTVLVGNDPVHMEISCEGVHQPSLLDAPDLVGLDKES